MSFKAKTNRQAFTIVELLIVIVIIGILAAITVVAYNGITQRANNTKTVNSVAAYVKALQLYKAENGDYPDVESCLGVGYPAANCHSSSAAKVENGGSLNSALLSPYVKNLPSPNTAALNYSSTLTLWGGFYIYGNSSYNSFGGGIGYGLLGTTTCPDIGGTTFTSKTNFYDGSGVWCRIALN